MSELAKNGKLTVTPKIKATERSVVASGDTISIYCGTKERPSVMAVTLSCVMSVDSETMGGSGLNEVWHFARTQKAGVLSPGTVDIANMGRSCTAKVREEFSAGTVKLILYDVRVNDKYNATIRFDLVRYGYATIVE